MIAKDSVSSPYTTITRELNKEDSDKLIMVSRIILLQPVYTSNLFPIWMRSQLAGSMWDDHIARIEHLHFYDPNHHLYLNDYRNCWSRQTLKLKWWLRELIGRTRFVSGHRRRCVMCHSRIKIEYKITLVNGPFGLLLKTNLLKHC